MSNMIAIKPIIAIYALSIIGLTACSKSQDNGAATIKINLIDAPSDYQAIKVEVLQIKLHHSTVGWIELPTIAGVYDLLTLQDNVSATLVDSFSLPAGEITQLRLVLGDENTIKIDDQMFPLDTPSGQMSGLKINIDRHFSTDQNYLLTVDFDAKSSIIEHGNGKYSLKPIIRLASISPV